MSTSKRPSKAIPLTTYFEVLKLAQSQGKKLNFAKIGRVVGHDQRTIAKLWSIGLRESVRFRRPPYPAIREILAGLVPWPEMPTMPEAAQRTPERPDPPEASEPTCGAPSAPAASEGPLVEDLEESPDGPPKDGHADEPPNDEPRAEPPPAPFLPVPTPAPPVVAIAPRPGVDFIESTELRKQAVAILSEELANLSVQRSAAQGLGVVALEALVGLRAQMARAKTDIDTELKMGGMVDIDKALKRLGRIAVALETAGKLNDLAVKTARLAVGSPTEIVRLSGELAPVAGASARPSTTDGNVWEIIAALRAMGKKRDDGQTDEPPPVDCEIVEGQALP